MLAWECYFLNSVVSSSMAIMLPLCYLNVCNSPTILITKYNIYANSGVSLGVSSLCRAGVCGACDVSAGLPWLCEDD